MGIPIETCRYCGREKPIYDWPCSDCGKPVAMAPLEVLTRLANAVYDVVSIADVDDDDIICFHPDVSPELALSQLESGLAAHSDFRWLRKSSHYTEPNTLVLRCRV